MTIRLALATALLLTLVPLDVLGIGSTHAQVPGSDLSPSASTSSTAADPAPDPAAASHRFFFANAQRESLTGTADARRRMGRMVGRLRHSRADLGVLVEIEGRQPDYFRTATDDAWGLIAGGRGVRDSVIYRRDTWTPVSRRIVPTYWKQGRRQRTPVVVLADASGMRVGVIPVHNPRDSARLSAVNNRRILAAVDDLQSQQIPVLVAGDFNSGRGATCRYTRRSPAMETVERRRAHPCRAGAPIPIDQAFATADLRLRDYREMPTTATDHRCVYAITFTPRDQA